MASEISIDDRANSEIIVIDASLCLRLALPNPSQLTVQKHFREWINKGYSLIAPSLWVYEVTSAINKSVRFEQITHDEGEETLRQILSLAIEVVPPSEVLAAAAFEWKTKLQRASAYDSFYLALADDNNAPMWTADGRLVRAVNQAWVQLGTE